jgi:3-oxoacyl-[acyl-carrier protein] reductase
MVKDLYEVTGKVAIVTGSSRGIGRAIATTLAEAGADVVINYNKSADQANEVKSEVESKGRRCVVVQADVGDFEQAQSLAKAALDSFGKIDILVNNAGINRDRTLRRMGPKEWNEVIQTN